MEANKGLCLLCSKQTVVFSPEQSENTISKLFGLLENQIDVQKSKPAFCEIKFCIFCVFEIRELEKFKANICESNSVCSFCKTEDKDALVSSRSVEDFHKLVENVFLKKMCQRRECVVCVQCIVYLNWLNRIKDNLFKKYPFLKLSCKSNKSLEKQLKGLKPVKNLNLRVNNANKKDAKLWAQVPFVKLNICKKLKKKASAPKPKAKLNRKPKILKLKMWQNLKKEVPSTPRKNKLIIKKELVVNLTKTELKQHEATVEASENLEVEPIIMEPPQQQTAVSSDEEDWSSSFGQRSYVEHLQKNNDAIFNRLLNSERQKSSLLNELETNSTKENNSTSDEMEVSHSTTTALLQSETTKDEVNDDERNQETGDEDNLICCNKKFEQFPNNIFV